jgi:hypothetical protein
MRQQQQSSSFRAGGRGLRTAWTMTVRGGGSEAGQAGSRTIYHAAIQKTNPCFKFSKVVALIVYSQQPELPVALRFRMV